MARLSWNLFYWFTSAVVAAVSLVEVAAATGISFAEVMPHLLHYAETIRLPLYAHIIFGPLALLLAPFQFWKGLRTRRPRVHRLIGYTYATSIVIAASSSLIMLLAFQGTAWAAAGFLILGLGWLFTTVTAVNFARKRDFVRHPRWMLRSAALTFAAVTLRIEMIPLLLSGMTVTETYNVTAWLSWLLPLGVVEWWLRRNPGPGRTVEAVAAA